MNRHLKNFLSLAAIITLIAIWCVNIVPEINKESLPLPTSDTITRLDTVYILPKKTKTWYRTTITTTHTTSKGYHWIRPTGIDAKLFDSPESYRLWQLNQETNKQIDKQNQQIQDLDEKIEDLQNTDPDNNR